MVRNDILGKMEHQLSSFLAWLQPNAVWIALVAPLAIRLVGHWLPEELFMMGLGVVAARTGSPPAAATLLAAVWVGHLVTDQLVYLGGLWLKPRLQRFGRLARPIEHVGVKLRSSSTALFGLIPARVLPLGRGAWLAACGVIGIRWGRFVFVDSVALVVHVGLWCGLGWWLGGEIPNLVLSAEMGRLTAVWLVVAAVTSGLGVLAWRRRWRVLPTMSREWRTERRTRR